jgi:2-dehydro-3-deoxygluconokinase
MSAEDHARSVDGPAKRHRIVTFGEAMLRLSVPGGVSLERAESFAVDIAGAEANVAVALARLGEDVAWISRVPDNALGRRTVNKLREHGVDVSHVELVPGGRLGLYFVELALPPRAGQVIYDRADSAFAQAETFPVGALAGATLLHLTGITAMVGTGPRGTADRLVRAAGESGVPVSFDLNYRAKLGSSDQACDICDQFAATADYLFVNRRDAAQVLGIRGTPEGQVAELKRRFPRPVCVMTGGDAGAWAYDDELTYQPALPGPELDRVGRGDAFCAGFLWGCLHGDVAYGLRCGVTLATLKQTYAGDIVWATREELLACVKGSGGLER